MSETGAETPGALFKAGRLDEAIAAANAAVRRAPADLGARVVLAELLVFAGNLERADVILDAAGQAQPEAAVVVAEFRQLVRAEMWRRQTRRDGRVPEFFDGPTEAQKALLAAGVALRAGDVEGAARHAAEAEAVRPRTPGAMTTVGAAAESPFDDFRDACDLHAGTFEVLTSTGKYYWIPTERVVSIVFHPPQRTRDLFWRRASVSVLNGPDGDVYIPAIYGSDEPADPAHAARALGRATDWIELAGDLTRGAGQRMFLAGEEAAGIMDVAELAFAPSA
jgi:type VI secretion system protein ImpE